MGPRVGPCVYVEMSKVNFHLLLNFPTYYHFFYKVIFV